MLLLVAAVDAGAVDAVAVACWCRCSTNMLCKEAFLLFL